ncbi:hypothetical protein F5Y16DRAFT_366048 [Xylariaceae sp. FL0255]|nr:hypothetical protein F5Y16DRAFT_366048 [Xylariaceae sp. FL0255]
MSGLIIPLLRSSSRQAHSSKLIPTFLLTRTQTHKTYHPIYTIETKFQRNFTNTIITKMQAAIVQEWSEGPRYVTVDEAPAPTESQIQLRVLAAGLHQVVRSRASGRHYSAHNLPHMVGIDCVGQDEATGKLYYHFSLSGGCFAERVTVDKTSAIPIPDGIDPVAFAGAVNPAMSSWMAITQRTNDLPKDFTVLILGATSASGRMAVHVAKELGAAKVVGVGRNESSLGQVDGLDDYIVQKEVVSETDFSKVSSGVDLVLDYVYGDLAVHALSTIETRARGPLQYVSIGSVSQGEANFPSAIFRSKDITMRGAGPGAWSISALQKELPVLVSAMAKWKLVESYGFPLKDIAEVWTDKSLASKGRLVAVP